MSIIYPYVLKIGTVSVTAGTEVTYKVCGKKWKTLPKEGIAILQINQTAPAGSDALNVNIAACCSTIPLVNGAGDPVTSAEITQGNRYLVYFNKCDDTIQIVNYIPATT